MATKVSATTTPAVVNGRVIPNQASRYCPTTPVRPSASSRATPPTTGGSTSGSVTRARSRRAARERGAGQHPGQRHAEHQRQPRWPSVAENSDSRSAVSTSASASSRGRPRHGARSSSPSSGSSRNTTADAGRAPPAATGTAGRAARRPAESGRGRRTPGLRWLTQRPSRRLEAGRRQHALPRRGEHVVDERLRRPRFLDVGQRARSGSGRGVDSAGISTPLTLLPADRDVGHVDEAGVDLAELAPWSAWP